MGGEDVRLVGKWMLASACKEFPSFAMVSQLCAFCGDEAPAEKMIVGVFEDGEWWECICVWCAEQVRDVLATVTDE